MFFLTLAEPLNKLRFSFLTMCSILNKLLLKQLIVLVLFMAFISGGCTTGPHNNTPVSDKEPAISPDYAGITIPFNIAPLNFRIKEEGSSFFARISSDAGGIIEVSSSSGFIKIPSEKWHNLLAANKGKDLRTDVYTKNAEGSWLQYKTIVNHINAEPADPYIYYRLLYPGYESWSDISIECRNTESFDSHPLLKNSAADDNCINCHSFNNGRTDNFMFHMRGSHAGTYFYSKGQFSKVNHKSENLTNGSVYPRWHPSGRFVAFSSNKIRQRFHSADNKKVEVSDLESCLVLYDVEKNEIMKIVDDSAGKYMDTFPEWSPDGKYLYFCRTPGVGENFDYKTVRYNLYRAHFDASARETGKPELVVNADSMGKSISFPRISPDGKFVIVTLADYGCFPIWHREADLYSCNLENKNISRLDLNSDLCESYHSWSSNGSWILFSSKRDDGLTARPYIAWFDGHGKTGKPFILPQEDPAFYDNYLKTFNIPEFSNTDIRLSPGEARRLAGMEAVQSKWVKNRKE